MGVEQRWTGRTEPHSAALADELEGAVPQVAIRLLGTCQVVIDGHQLEDAQIKRVRSLVARLALGGSRRQNKGALAAAFWPESTHSQATTNLRKTLFDLRRLWPQLAALLDIDRTSIGFSPGIELKVDVEDFERLARQAVGEGELRRVRALYRGELLPGVEAAWLDEPRDRLRSLYDRLGAALARLLEEERDYQGALALVEELTAETPGDEEAWEWALRLALAASGRAGVERQWRRCERSFLQEFSDPPPDRLAEARRQLVAASEQALGQPVLEFVGRRREWRQLRSAWDLSRSGQFGLVWVQGEGGIGKSALVGEFGRWLVSQGVTVRLGQASAVGAGAAMEAVVSALGGGLPAGLGAPWREAVAALVERRPLLSGALGTDPESARLRRLMALTEALRADAPVLWVLDDMHEADLETWAWLKVASRHLGRVPALVVAVSRADRQTVARRRDLFETVGSQAACQLVVLGPLGDDESLSLLRQVASAPPAVEAELLALAGGNPLHLVEAARVWSLERSLGGTGVDLGPTMKATLFRRLRLLPAEQRQLTRTLAVFGRPMSEHALLACTPRASATSLAALVQARLVSMDGRRQVFFYHSAFIPVALEGMTKSQIAGRAADLARHLSSGGAGAYELGALWELAGNLEAAGSCYAQAAKEASRSAYQEATAEAFARLAAVSEPADLPQVALWQAESLYRFGSLPEASLAYEHALSLAVQSGDGRRAAISRLGLARLASVGGDLKTAQVMLKDSLEALADLGDQKELARALLCQGEVLGQRQEHEAAETLLEQARRMAESEGDLSGATQALIQMGDSAFERAAYDQATASYQRARRLAEKTGDISLALEATSSLGAVLEETGEVVAAASYQRDAVEAAHGQQLPRLLCYGLNNLGVCYQDVGRFEDAECLLRLACQLAVDLQDLRATTVTANVLAIGRGRQGDWAGAYQLWEIAMALARAFPLPGYLVLYICHFTDVLLDQGNPPATIEQLFEEGASLLEAASERVAVRLKINRLRWLMASGVLRRDELRQRILALDPGGRLPAAQALIAYRAWQASGRQEDRTLAIELMRLMLIKQPHEWWQHCLQEMSGELAPLPELPAIPTWVAERAPNIDDLLPALTALGERHGRRWTHGAAKETPGSDAWS